MAKMKIGSKAYNAEALELLLCFTNIYPCIDCNHPIKEGCCCGHCGSGNGSDPDHKPSIINYTAKASY